MDRPRPAKIVLGVAALACLTPYVPAAGALGLGIAVAQTLGNPLLEQMRKVTPHFLSLSVIGLGAGMNLIVVGRVGAAGFGYTILGISLALLVGLFLGRVLKTDRDTSLLVTVGTAICGGSAIAAVAPVLRARPHQVSVALGTVFLLNAIALLLFPVLGHHFGLDEGQFGLWSALAIHDTSSVVGATLRYGKHALEVGTTVKLARALWIVPVAFGVGAWRARSKSADSGPAARAKRPWFIAGFLLMAALVTWIPALQGAGHVIEEIAKRTLVLTLFFIGATLNRETLRQVGLRPLVQGTLLWIFLGITSLGAILAGWIHA